MSLYFPRIEENLVKDLFKTIIKDFQDRLPIGEIKERDLNIPIGSGKIISLIGPRRSGKTYYFYFLMNQLLEQTSPQQIVYINFEDERLEISKEHFQSLIEAYFELYPNQSSQDIHFFFDEIHEISGWEKFVRRMYDSVSKNIFITGSSSRMLGKEIATHLRGRHLVFQLFPLSFAEYCRFQGLDTADFDSTRNKAALRKSLSDYLSTGGFPEILFLKPDLIPKTLQSYFDVMIFRDIIERHQIKNTTALKYFIKKLFDTIASEVSIHKIYNELKSMGIRLNKDRLYQYLEHVTDCFLFFIHYPFDSSIRKSQMSNKKIYAIDPGLVNAITFRFQQNYGKLLENVVFLHLARNNQETYFLRNAYECDFILTDEKGISAAIQVSYQHSAQSTKERETNSLLKALERFNLNQGLIITYDEKEALTVDKKRIEIVPAWQWLLKY